MYRVEEDEYAFCGELKGEDSFPRSLYWRFGGAIVATEEEEKDNAHDGQYASAVYETSEEASALGRGCAEKPCTLGSNATR